MTFAGDGKLWAYLGDPEQGKSVFARRRALEEGTTPDGDVRDGHVLIYVTPNGEETDPWPGPTLSVERVESLLSDDSAEVPEVFAVRGGPRAYEAAARVALDVAPRLRPILVVDECHRVFRENFSDALGLAECFHEGRHRGIDLHVITQWPARADKRLFRASRCTHWFHLHEADDMEWICRRYSVRAAEEVLALAPYEHVDVPLGHPPSHWIWRSDRRDREAAGGTSSSGA